MFRAPWTSSGSVILCTAWMRELIYIWEVVWLQCQLSVEVIIQPETNRDLIQPKVGCVKKKEEGYKYCSQCGCTGDDQSWNSDATDKKWKCKAKGHDLWRRTGCDLISTVHRTDAIVSNKVAHVVEWPELFLGQDRCRGGCHYGAQ